MQQIKFMDRNTRVQGLRPTLEISMQGEKNAEEEFMHQTLRPVLKFQHDLICELLKAEAHLDLNLLAGKNKTELEKRAYLSDYIVKNVSLKNTLLGTIIGLFGADEVVYYLQNRKGINKRIVEMILTRFLSEMN